MELTDLPTRPGDPSWLPSAFCSGRYRFDRFKADPSPRPRLLAPPGIDFEAVQRIADAIAFGRDLINTPANILGPSALEEEVIRLAKGFGARVDSI